MRVVAAKIEKEMKFMYTNAAIVVKAKWKGYVQLRGFQQLRKATICVQSYFRMYMAQKVAIQLRQQRLQQQQDEEFVIKTHAAVILQTAWRRYMSQTLFLKQHALIIHMQSNIRRSQAIKFVQRLRVERLEAHRLVENTSARTLQAVWRGYVARQAFLQYRSNVVRMQSCIRRALAVQRVQTMRTHHALENRSAVVIQGTYTYSETI